VNEEWASDKTRHAVDGLMHGRLDKPYVRKNGKLVAVDWNEAFVAIKAVWTGEAAVIAGDQVDCETMFAARELAGAKMLEGRQTGLAYDASSLSAVNFNTGIANIENADVILLVGSDLRREAPLVNTRLQKAVRRKGAKVFAIGPVTDLTYHVTWLGDDVAALAKPPKALADALKSAERPAIIVGGGALRYEGVHGAALAFAKKYKLVREGWNGFNVLHFAAARMGGLMLGYAYDGGIKALAKKKPKLAFFLGSDEADYGLFAGTFKVYVGHHGDAGAKAADVILPGAAYTEKSGTYVNLEGRVQRGERAVFPPGEAREDWSIFRALSEVLGAKLPFDTLDQLRAQMAKSVPALGVEGLASYEWNPPKLADKPVGVIADYPIKDFYLTNAICRASPTMRRCSDELVHGVEYAEAAE
jgi:NADH-quinone oxidoreductase subunit G